jgi:hypothetical protein
MNNTDKRTSDSRMSDRLTSDQSEGLVKHTPAGEMPDVSGPTIKRHDAESVEDWEEHQSSKEKKAA